MKRFYKEVEWAEAENGFEVLLDGRQVKSPAKRALVLPSQKLAEEVAAEWAAIEDEIDPQNMPQFSLAVTVADRVTPQRGDLLTEMVRYGLNDLICYRADSDERLISRQAEQWDSWLGWAAEQHHIHLKTTAGIMPLTQDSANHDRLMAAITPLDDWRLGALVRATSLGGSLILGLAFVARALSADTLFSLSFLDELYQGELWGQDEEAVSRQAHIKDEFQAAETFLALL